MSHEGRRASELQAARRSRWQVGAVAAALAIVAITAVLILARPGPPAELSSDGEPTLGAADAPVILYYYGDFQCPACRRFELGGELDRLRATYVEPGTARLVVKDFPILGDDSVAAARASQFVWGSAPGSYWDWHRGLYVQQGAERSGWASPERIVAYSARFPGVDLDGLRAAMAGGPIADEVDGDEREGADHGVRATPSLLIGGRVVAALDAGAVDEAIRDALAARGAG